MSVEVVLLSLTADIAGRAMGFDVAVAVDNTGKPVADGGEDRLDDEESAPTVRHPINLHR